jgi:prenylcysteine oxidase/farnesylcysteine lyase
VSTDLLDRLYTNRTWVKHKEWKAYPKLKPIPVAPEEGEEDVVFEGDNASSEQVVFEKHARKQKAQKEYDAQKKALEAWRQVEIAPGFFYVNSFEPLISVSFLLFFCYCRV